jgi:hypothetical protein
VFYAVTETVVTQSGICFLVIIPLPLVAQNLEIHVINVGWAARFW